jgi:dynein heavy chain
MIIDQMEKFYVEFPPFDLQGAFDDSSNFRPLIFVLSTGADPRVEVETLATKMSMNSKLIIRSLGQGQGEFAIQAIQEGIE